MQGGFMQLQDALLSRRALRALSPVSLGEDAITQLAQAAQVAPSCFNNQPWRYLFITEPTLLKALESVYSKGNEWAFNASAAVVVSARKEDDCVIHDREYYLFDTGIATGFMMLKATEMGLVAHPIAGYSPRKLRALFSFEPDETIIAMLVIGAADTTHPAKHDEQRPPRKELAAFIRVNPPVKNA
jgi:nitroreductase